MKKIFFYSFLTLFTLLSLSSGLNSFLYFFLFSLLTFLLNETAERRDVPNEHLLLIFFSLLALLLILSHTCTSFADPGKESSFFSMSLFLAECLILSMAISAGACLIVATYQTGRKWPLFFLAFGLFFFLISASFEGFYPVLMLFFFLFALSHPFLERSSQRFKVWLFVGLLLGWVFFIFIVMPNDTLFNPEWSSGILLSSLFYNSLIRLLLATSFAFTLSLPLSLIIGSRKARTKTAASYIFLSIIPIIILISLIWLYVLFQLKFFPVFLIWRENVGAVKSMMQSLSLEVDTFLKTTSFNDGESPRKLKAICQKYEDVLTTQFSKPSVFITLFDDNSDAPIMQVSSKNGTLVQPSQLLHPLWIKEDSKSWIFLEDQRLFLKGVKYHIGSTMSTSVTVYIPLEEQNIDTIHPKEYKFSLQFDNPTGLSYKIPKRTQRRVNLSVDELMRIISGGDFPILAIVWETGEYLIAGSFSVQAYALRGIPSSLFFYLTTIYIILFLGSFLALNMIILSSIFGYAINRTIKKSFNAIVQGASHFSKGNFHHKIQLKSRDEYSTIAGALNQMAVGVQKYTEEVIKKELMDRELSIASEIQRKIFPDTLPSLRSFDFGVISRPFGKVGGDYYDFIEYPGGELAVVIADASGKGMPAALMVSSLNAILHSYAKQEKLTSFFVSINARLRKVATENAFISMVFCILHENQNTFRYINAGHPYPIMIKGKNKHFLLKEGGVSLGMLDDISMKEGAGEIQPGDIIILVTDGISETFNSLGEEFGTERLRETVLQHSDKKAQDIAEAVFEELENFSGSAQLTDDATCIIIKKT